MDVALQLVYSAGQIADAVRRLAGEITESYAGCEICFVVVLKGALLFASDLVRQVQLPLSIEFARLVSYRGTASTGRIVLRQEPDAPLAGRHVLVVEDIVDTGLTTKFFLEHLQKQQPASLRLCTLLDKKGRRQVPIAPDFVGISCEDQFLVGYGLDLDERYRQLPDIYTLVS